MMKHRILCENQWNRAGVVLTALALLTGGLAIGKSAPSPNPGVPVSAWSTLAASGPVQAWSALGGEEVWQDVSRGDELESETHVKTGRKGRATLSRSASVLILAPRSEVELPGVGRGDMETSVIQTSGSVLYKVDGRSNPHFEVVTPYLVAGVKGTTFLVTVNDRYTSVVVKSGLVEIRDPDTGEIFHLRPGESAIHHRERDELELVYDLRRSREARDESRKLDRMHDLAENRDRELLAFDAFDSPQDPGKSDKMAKELLEEMIGEGIHDGELQPAVGVDDDSLGNVPKLVPEDENSGPGSGVD